jgi:branched-chain amino acid transport system substrate-binding protein
MRALRRNVLAGFLALGMAATAGCAAAPSEGGELAGLKTGKGVSDDTISILSLTDLSGPAASGGKPLQAAFDAYMQKLNASGGIDGRKIRVETADHQYNAQKGVQLYQGASDNVAAVWVYGTATADAIRPFTLEDHLLTLGMKGAYPEENSFGVAPGYEVESANLLSYVLKKTPDAKIGVIYQADAVGNAVKRGVEAVEKTIGLKIVAEASADASSTDLTAQVSSMRSAGADHILLATAPGATIAAVGAASSLGYDAKFLSPGTAFSKPLLDLPVGPALEANFLGTCSYPLWNQGSAAMKEMKEALGDSTKPDSILGLGWISGMVMEATLRQAVRDGDLTPAGIAAAAQKTTVDTHGMTPEMKYGSSIAQRSPFLESQICTVSKDAPDGMVLEAEYFESEAAGIVEYQ